MKSKQNFTYQKVDKYNAVMVLVFYRHDNPTEAINRYSKWKDQERTFDEQLDAVIGLIGKYQKVARTMILYENCKKGTGPKSDLPDNVEYLRIHHGKTLDFSRSVLDQDSQFILTQRLAVLSIKPHSI